MILAISNNTNFQWVIKVPGTEDGNRTLVVVKSTEFKNLTTGTWSAVVIDKPKDGEVTVYEDYGTYSPTMSPTPRPIDKPDEALKEIWRVYGQSINEIVRNAWIQESVAFEEPKQLNVKEVKQFAETITEPAVKRQLLNMQLNDSNMTYLLLHTGWPFSHVNATLPPTEINNTIYLQNVCFPLDDLYPRSSIRPGLTSFLIIGMTKSVFTSGYEAVLCTKSTSKYPNIRQEIRFEGFKDITAVTKQTAIDTIQSKVSFDAFLSPIRAVNPNDPILDYEINFYRDWGSAGAQQTIAGGVTPSVLSLGTITDTTLQLNFCTKQPPPVAPAGQAFYSFMVLNLSDKRTTLRFPC